MIDYLIKKNIYSRTVSLVVVMLLALLASFLLTPEVKMSAKRNAIDFNAMIPKSFGKWKLDTSLSNQLVDPEVKKTLDSVYSQTVSRTYISDKGQIVMLSIAYGGDQEEVMQVHKPEVCYTAQGFSVSKKGTMFIQTDKGTILAKLLLTKQAERIEPVTYWITIGNSIALNGLQWRFERIKYGLTGNLPDGLLFRVSSLGPNADLQYDLHRVFIKDLFMELSNDQSLQLIGKAAID